MRQPVAGIVDGSKVSRFPGPRLPSVSLRIRGFIVLALGLITISRLVGFAAAEDAAVGDAYRAVDAARQLQADDQDFRLVMADQDVQLTSYLAGHKPEDLVAFQQSRQASLGLRSRLASEVPAGSLLTAFVEADTAAQAWQAWADAQLRPNSVAAAGSSLMAAFRGAADRFTTALRTHSSQLMAAARAEQRYDYAAIAACAAVAAMSMLLLSYLVILAVAGPIARLAGQARELAADMTAPLDQSRRRDEIGELERALCAYRYAVSERLAVSELLAEQSTRFHLVFDRAPLGLCRLGLDGTVLESNPALRSLLGYAPERLQGLNLHGIAHADEADRNRQLFKAAAEGSQGHLTFETRLLNSDGNWVWCSLSGAAVRDAEGRPLFLVGLLENIDERKGQELLLQHQAEHDPLTGLPNRALFFARLGRLATSAAMGEGFAVLVIDLDGFKQVNDREGHQAGDHLLQMVAGRLREKLRVSDTLARLGGDEFAAILPGSDEAGAHAAAAKLVAAMQVPFKVTGSRVQMGASIGIAVCPIDGATSHQLMRTADRALYGAKRGGGGRALSVRELDEALAAGA